MTPQALALQTYRVLRNSFMDLQYGRLLLGRVPTRFKELGAVSTENTDYGALAEIFADCVTPDDVLVDVGCGKGRVINFWLKMGLRNRIYGLELDPEIARATSERLRGFGNVTILSGHVLDTVPDNGTLFYLYNPFNAPVLENFKRKLETLPTLSRLRVLYYNCRHLDVFEQDPAWSVDIVQIGNKRSPLPYSRFAIVRPSPPARSA